MQKNRRPGPEPVVLLAALGNVDLILEYLDFFNGGARFSYTGEAEQVRRAFSGSGIAAVHLICTADSGKKLKELEGKVVADYPEVAIEPLFLRCTDIETAADEQEMKEEVYALVEKLAGSTGRLIISSGGRKTMTNRLIEAGLLHGCEGYLAITDSRQTDRDKPIRDQTNTFNILWIPARQFYRERCDAIPLRDGIGDNFRSLAILPQSVLKKLQEERIGVDREQSDRELVWLRKLPKADLHCHLGGAFDLPLLRKLARLMVEDCRLDTSAVKKIVEEKTGVSLPRLTSGHLRSLRPEVRHCLDNLEELLDPVPPDGGIPALVAQLTDEQIEDLSFDSRKMRDCRAKDLAWYMTCGDLGGSALLQTERCLRAAMSWLLQRCYDDGVRYLEVRCSPDNYCRRDLDIRDVLNILIDEGRSFMRRHDDFTVNLLVMATRHKSRAAMASHVSAAVCFAGNTHQGSSRTPRVVGFDLAGQEKDHDPVQFRDLFMPLHHHFINITIHAGEMEDDDRIWQALYVLHAKRIGHGLKLINNRKMMHYIRDYGTAIEMCPSSNVQTNSFHLPGDASPRDRYPLKEYLRHGIAVTINTDNPGISATHLSREYLVAARLSENGLSRWDILKLVRNGFRAAFLPKDEKDRLLKKVDRQIFDIILNNYFQEDRS